MSNTERIVSAFSAKELKTLVIALKRFNDQVGPYNSVLMEKLINGFLLANDLENTVEIGPVKDPTRMGMAESKAWMAENC